MRAENIKSCIIILIRGVKYTLKQFSQSAVTKNDIRAKMQKPADAGSEEIILPIRHIPTKI